MPDLGIPPFSVTLFMNTSCKTMMILSDLGYLFRSGLLLQFLVSFRLFESVYVILRTLMLESMVDLYSEYTASVYPSISMFIFRYLLGSCFACTGFALSLIIILRSSTVVWKTFTEPVRFGRLA